MPPAKIILKYGFVYLLAIHPVLSLFSHNADEVQFYELLVPVGLVLVVTMLMHGVLLATLGSPQKANSLVILFNAFLFYYAYLLGVFQNASMFQFLGIVGGRSFLKFYLAALVVAVSVIFLLSETALEKAAFVIKRFAVAIILVTLVFLARNKIASWDFRDPGEPKDVARASAASSSNPDIYHIVLDGYGRHDYLKEFYEYDNGEFIEWLEQKGFYVAHASRSNYPLTRFSLASFLNYEYLDGIPLEKEWTFFNMIQNNKAMRFLRERGYNVVTFETGQTSFDIKRLATHYESMPLVLSEFQNEILNLTLLPTLFKAADFQNTLHRNVILRVFDKLAQPFWEPSPKLVYAHIRTPHPPYVFDAQGNFLSPEKLELLPELTPERYKRQLAGQTQFTTAKVQEIVGKILEHTRGDAVVILHSDHGPAFTTYPGMEMEERLAILNAVYFPEGDYEDFTPETSPVNLYRLVFNAVFHSEFAILEDASYLYTSFGWERFVADEQTH